MKRVKNTLFFSPRKKGPLLSSYPEGTRIRLILSWVFVCTLATAAVFPVAYAQPRTGIATEQLTKTKKVRSKMIIEVMQKRQRQKPNLAGVQDAKRELRTNPGALPIVDRHRILRLPEQDKSKKQGLSE